MTLGACVMAEMNIHTQLCSKNVYVCMSESEKNPYFLLFIMVQWIYM